MKIFGRKLNFVSFGLFYRQLAIMLTAGVALREALHSVCQESDQPQIRRANEIIRTDLANGVPLSESLAKHPKVFNAVLVNIAKHEDQLDKLSKALHKIADATEHLGILHNKVFRALFFPSLTFLFAILVTLVILIFVIPVFREMFANFGSHLPAPTQFIVNVSDWLKQNFFFLLAATLIVLIILIANKHLRHRLAAILPGLRMILQRSSIIIFARHLSIMLAFEFPLNKSITSAAVTVTNTLHSQKLAALADKTSDLQPLKQKLQSTGLFSPPVLQMIDAGEKSNALSLVMDEVSKFYEKDFDRSLSSLWGSLWAAWSYPCICRFLKWQGRFPK
jgi:type IV pilus assembly protein PilC